MSADLSSQVEEDFEDELAELDEADEQAGAEEDREVDVSKRLPPRRAEGKL